MQADQGFLKGLAVVDDVAYFGISPPMERQNRDGPNVQCDLVAVDLLTHQQVFRHKIDTRGLLNIVSSPELSETSSYVAQQTPWGRQRPSTPAVSQGPLKTTMAQLKTFTRTQAGQADSMAQNLAVATRDSVGTFGSDTSLSTEKGEALYRWSESWLDAPLDQEAASGKWLTSMPRMDLALKQSALGGGGLGRHGAMTNLPVHLHLGKVIPELIRPAQVRFLIHSVQQWYARFTVKCLEGASTES